jgi:acetyltransferase
MDKHFLKSLFAPASIVVFAKPDEVQEPGEPPRTLRSFVHAQRFEGTLRFVDIHATGTLADLAQARADLAIIALPHEELAAALEAAGRMKCRAALIVSSGVRLAEAEELKKIARREGMHLLGPNSLGFQRPKLGLNASVLGPLATSGSLALVSQSGALTASMLDWATNNAVGFSTVVALGANGSIDAAQVLDYLASDSQTQSILIYMEGISNARRFMSALRTAASAKPTIVLKAGRDRDGNEAARTHCSAIVGNDDAFDAALRRAGAVRVRSFVELFSAAKCLASRYRPVGRHLAIITNGGGPGVLAADWINEIGLELGKLSGASAAELQPLASSESSLVDLIDLSEDARPEHYQNAVQVCDRDRGIDGVLVIYSPKAGRDGAEAARALVACKQTFNKPLLACWMGDASINQGRRILNEGSIPTFRTPEAAVGAFGNIASFVHNQRLLQQTPSASSTSAKSDIEGARLIIESVLAERRHVLTEMESKTLLASFHIPVTNTILARTANEAMMIASQLGFPVALKIDSPDVAHKSDVQGVALNVMNGIGVRDTFTDIVENVKRAQPSVRINGVTVQRMARAQRGREIYVGLTTDEAFGPVIVFGSGGTMIELIDDRAMELPPLNQFLARRLIERARVAKTLGDWRGAPGVSMEAIEQILLRVSEMACELPWLREMDINPIIVDASGAIAVDARIVIDSAPASIGGRTNRYNHLAILPYPSHFEQIWPLAGGGEFSLRPIHPGDAQMLQDLMHHLSPESRYFRFVSSIIELPATMLARFTLIDYDREMALVAVVHERVEAENGLIDKERIVGVSRYVTDPDQTSCEFALVIADDYNGKGLGTRLMESIMEAARDKGLTEMYGLVLANNSTMLRLMRRLGFEIKPLEDDREFKLVTHAL